MNDQRGAHSGGQGCAPPGAEGRPADLGKIVALALGLTLVAPACIHPRSTHTQQENHVERPTRPIEQVQETHTAGWMRLPGVIGTGIGLCDDEEPCIRVFLAERSPEAEKAIPDRVEGYRVELVVTGRFRPRGPP